MSNDDDSKANNLFFVAILALGIWIRFKNNFVTFFINTMEAFIEFLEKLAELLLIAAKWTLMIGGSGFVIYLIFSAISKVDSWVVTLFEIKNELAEFKKRQRSNISELRDQLEAREKEIKLLYSEVAKLKSFTGIDVVESVDGAAREVIE